MTGIPDRVSLAALIAAAIMISGCGAGQANDDQSASERNEPASAGAGKTASETASKKNAGTKAGANADDGRRETGAEPEDRKAAKKAGGKGQPRRVALSLRGEPGTAFSGVCVVGGERTDFAAKTPQRYVFRAQRPGLECRIVKKGADDSTLRAVLLAKGERHAQRTNSEQSVIALSLSKRGFSSEIRSSSGLAGGKSSSMVRMGSEQDSSVVTIRREGERDVAR